jgi:hypothetical protein
MPDEPAPAVQDELSLSPRGVLIPWEPQEFADFLSKLLGKPQVASGGFTGVVDIHLQEIENFYLLIEQRLREQNVSQLIEFSAVIKFNDGTSIEFPTFDELRSYSEIKPLVSIGIYLSWVYLVSFQNKRTPERQQIEVKINSDIYEGIRLTQPANKTDYFGSRFDGVVRSSRNNIMYRISYTARTWGADIENMLQDHIRSLLIQDASKIKKWFSTKSEGVGVCIGFLLFAAFFMIGIVIIQKISAYKLTHYTSLITLDTKIDYIATITAGNWGGYMLIGIVGYLIVAITLSAVIPGVIFSSVSWERPSFVALTRLSQTDRVARIKRYERSWRVFWTSVFSAIGTSIVGNIVTFFYRARRPRRTTSYR